MVELVKDRCRCCSNRGLSKCISLQNADAAGNHRRTVFEVGRRLDMGCDEVPRNSNVEEGQQRMKRICVEQNKNKELAEGEARNEDDAPVYNNPVVQREPDDTTKMFEDRIVVYA